MVFGAAMRAAATPTGSTWLTQRLTQEVRKMSKVPICDTSGRGGDGKWNANLPCADSWHAHNTGRQIPGPPCRSPSLELPGGGRILLVRALANPFSRPLALGSLLSAIHSLIPNHASLYGPGRVPFGLGSGMLRISYL